MSVTVANVVYTLDSPVQGEATATGYDNPYWDNLTIQDTVTDGNTTYNVTAIADFVFESAFDFTGSLTIGNNVQTIGNGAFYECAGFTGSLDIPNSVTNIGNTAF